MMFRLPRRRATLNRALMSAVTSHRPLILRELLTGHGDAAFAAALAPNSGRVIADALSQLPAAERARVLRRLSRLARERLERAGGPPRPNAARALVQQHIHGTA